MTSDYIPSAAAIEFARPRCFHPSGDYSACATATAFDAGVAHEAATRTPRVLTTAAELDVLPLLSAVLDRDGDVWQKAEAGWILAGGVSEDPANVVIRDGAPLTLLVPASEPVPAEPEPIRLTDPEDPRIKPGARVRMVVEYVVDEEGSDVYRYPVQLLRKAVAMPSDHETFYLLAEAPADPVDPRVELLAAALHGRGGCEDEWPTCAISTLEHYRDAARNLLPILDGARADQ